MNNKFRPLPQKIMPVATQLSSPTQEFEQVGMDDPAIKVMTDLKRVSSITIGAENGVDDARYKMKQRKVKLLFVVDHNEYIIGIVTLNDIIGEKLQKTREEFNLPVSELCILDVMIGIDNIDVLEYDNVIQAKVGDIVQTLRSLNRQHALVLQNEHGIQKIRGIFSSSQINKQLKTPVDLPLIDEYNNIFKPDLLFNHA